MEGEREREAVQVACPRRFHLQRPDESVQACSCRFMPHDVPSHECDLISTSRPPLAARNIVAKFSTLGLSSKAQRMRSNIKLKPVDAACWDASVLLAASLSLVMRMWSLALHGTFADGIADIMEDIRALETLGALCKTWCPWCHTRLFSHHSIYIYILYRTNSHQHMLAQLLGDAGFEWICKCSLEASQSCNHRSQRCYENLRYRLYNIYANTIRVRSTHTRHTHNILYYIILN